MDFKTFLEHFDTIAHAPNGIAKLRSLILDMAIRGKLVPQNPDDESAIILFDKISFEKQQLIQEEIIKKDKNLPQIGADEIPFQIPSTWKWARLNDVFDVRDGTHFSPKYLTKGIPFVTSKNLYGGILDLTNVKYISEEDHKSFSERSKVDKLDILFAMIGSIGNPVIVDVDLQFSIKNVALFKYYSLHLSEPRFLHCFLKYASLHMQRQSLGGVQSFVSLAYLRKYLFPLPPLAEQKRIVEKVDELMALCDRDEAAKQTRDDLRQKLRESSIASLMNAQTDEEFQKSWAMVRDNWHTINRSPEDVDDARKVILSLAISGKLVPQDPEDEPAEKLLKIVAAKHSVNPTKFRKPKGLKPIDSVDKPFLLPPGWCWCRFTDVGLLERGRSKHRPRNEPLLYENGSIPLVQTGDVARAMGVITTYTALYNERGLAQSRLWSKGTLCITIAANIADSAILGFDACFPDSIVGFIPTEPIRDSRYFDFFVRTVKSRLESFAPSTAQKNINLAILDEVLIPLPPLAEQKRIVAKVDELMKICDQLEESLRQSSQRAEVFAASAISHLTI